MAGMIACDEDDYYRDNFLPLDTMSYIGLSVLGLMLVIATMGGVGGNVVILPVLLIFFQFDPKVAIGHTSLFSALSGLSRVLYERFQCENEDGEKKKKRVNFHLVLLSGAPAILGSFIGANMNKLSPEIIIMATALVLQLFLLFFSFKQFNTKRKEEKEQLTESVHESTSRKSTEINNASREFDDNLNALLLTDASPLTSNYHKKSNKPLTSSLSPTSYASFRTQESRLTKIETTNFMILALFMVLSPGFEYLRGSNSTPSIIDNEYCSDLNGILIASYVAVLIILGLICREMVLIRNRNVILEDSDLELSPSTTIKFMFSILLVATVGGFVSAGSSTLLTMMIIYFGLSPFNASSTSLFVVIIFSGSSASIYYLNGFIYGWCVVIAGAVVVLSTLLTRMTLYQYFLRHGKASIILLFISLMMLITIPSNIMQVGPHIKKQYDKGVDILEFKSFCE